jgi:hypothetical protein
MGSHVAVRSRQNTDHALVTVLPALLMGERFQYLCEQAISVTQPGPAAIANRKSCNLTTATTKLRPRPRPSVRKARSSILHPDDGFIVAAKLSEFDTPTFGGKFYGIVNEIGYGFKQKIAAQSSHALLRPEVRSTCPPLSDRRDRPLAAAKPRARRNQSRRACGYARSLQCAGTL